MLRTASGRVFCCLVLGGDVASKPVIPPETEKPARARPRSPKSAMRSINSCPIRVKRKTLNVVDVFVLRLFVVVMLHDHTFTLPSVFIHPAGYTKASNRWWTGPYFSACAKLFWP